MKRTYNTLIDNGLFVLAYHLEKDIEDITKEDVFNSSDMMAEKIFEMLNCEKYANMKSMRFPNSALINPAFKNDRLGIFKQHMDEFKNEGTDTCVICGEKHANIELDIRGRSYFPNIVGDNFVNFGNNHKGVNICPTCLLLSIYSVMNTRVNGTLYLFNSNDDDFMMEYTYKRQDEVIQDIINKAEKEKKTETAIDVLIDLVENSKIYEEYIEIYRFNNDNKSDRISDSENVYKKQVQLINKMQNKNLLSEFRMLRLSGLLLNNNMKNFLNRIYDFNKGCMRDIEVSKKETKQCSKELFDFMKGEILNMDKGILSLIEKVGSELTKKDNIRSIIGDLKTISNINQFKDFLMENIEDSNGESILTKDEYLLMTNRFKWKDIKNLLLIEIL